MIEYSSYAQQFSWEGFGLKLSINGGSLPAGVEHCSIHIKASLAGLYEFPDKYHLISAVFWFRCTPNMCKFTKPIKVELQHCAKPQNVSKLTFVRAVCSQKQLPYTFQELPGGHFNGCSYGIIELKSFSGVAIVQEESDDRQYYSKLCYLSDYIRGDRIDLIVTWNTEAHLNVSLYAKLPSSSTIQRVKGHYECYSAIHYAILCNH